MVRVYNQFRAFLKKSKRNNVKMVAARELQIEKNQCVLLNQFLCARFLIEHNVQPRWRLCIYFPATFVKFFISSNVMHTGTVLYTIVRAYPSSYIYTPNSVKGVLVPILHNQFSPSTLHCFCVLFRRYSQQKDL